MTEAMLDDWIVTITEALGIPADGIDVAEILDLASVAAHQVVRPAAPLTTFVAGLAAGLAGGTPEAIRAALATAVATAESEA